MAQYPSDYSSQVTYITNLISELNELDLSIDGITLVQSTKPTHNEWEAEWVASGRPLPIRAGAELIWHDGTTIRGIYSVVNDDLPRLLMEFQWVGLTSSPTNIVKSVDVDSDSKSILTVGSWDDLASNTINYIDRDGTWTSIGAVAGTEAYVKFNDDCSQIVYLDSGGNAIYKASRTGAGALNIINGYGAIALHSWSGPYIAFSIGVTLRLADDVGTVVATIAASAPVYEAIWNPTDSKVYYTAGTDLYRNDLTGLAEELIYVGSGRYFDIDIDNQKIYINHYTRMDMDGTNVEVVPDVVYDEYLKIYERTSDGTNEIVFGAATTIVESLYWIMNIFSRDPRQFVLAPNKKYFVQRLWLPDPDEYNILIIPNYFETDKSSGFIWQLTQPTAGVEDFQKIAEATAVGHVPFLEVTIPQTHGDLMIITNLETYDNTALADVGILVNDDATANNYNNFHREMAAAMTKAETLNAGYIRLRVRGRTYNPTTNFSNTVIFIHDYKEPTIYKQFIGFGGNPARTDATPNIYINVSVGIYSAANSAITKLKFYATTGLNLHDGSYVTVYGLNTQGGMLNA